MADKHGPIENLSYDELRMRVLNEYTDDLVVFINRWSSLKRATNDASALVRVWMTKLAPHWKGDAGRTCMAELDKLAKWTEQIATVAGANLVANEDLHRAVLKAQREMKVLDTQPNNAPPPPALVTLDGERDRRPPAERDSRQPTAARIAKTLAWAYTNHTTNVTYIPDTPPDRRPGSDTKAELGGGGTSGSPPAARQTGGGNPATLPSYDPGPTLAGHPTAASVSPDTSSTGSTVRPGSVTGPNTSITGVPSWAAGSQYPGSRSTSGGGLPTNSTNRGTTPTTGSSSGAPKGGGQPPPAGGRPPTGTQGTPMAPSASAPPRDDKRRGRGTDLREDPDIWLTGVRKPPPGTIGTPRRIATSDEQDEYIPEPPPPTNHRGRDERGFPSQIPEGQFSTNEGARINIRMGPKTDD